MKVLAFCGLLLFADLLSAQYPTLFPQKDLALIEQRLGPLPDSIHRHLVLLEVDYYSFDTVGRVDSLHLQKGQLVVHQLVKEDLEHIFAALRHRRFPIAHIRPIHLYGLNRDSTGWSDSASMSDNNSSAFNYRYLTHSTQLSPHALGLAIDFNPLFNPYESYQSDGKWVEPEAALYISSRPGTISDSVIVGYFDQRGWTWGGRWNNPVDYQHFDKRLGRARKHYLMKESRLKDYFAYHADGAISLYAEPYFKKIEQPEIYLHKADRRFFLQALEHWGEETTYQLFSQKGRQSWKQWQRGEGKKIARLPQLPKNPAPTPLNNQCICLDIAPTGTALWDSLNYLVVSQLSEKLRSRGILVQEQPKKGKNCHIQLLFAMGSTDVFGERTADKEADFQVLYIPGAWRREQLISPKGRLHFLRLLIGEDWPRSLKLAQRVQYQLQNHLNLAPVSRQLAAPNLLEAEAIMSDIDGIYCRYIESLAYNTGTSLAITAYYREEDFGTKWSVEAWVEKLSEGVLQALIGGND